MKIPKKIKVGGMVYDIEIKNSFGDTPDGILIHNESKMVIVNRASQQLREQTFFHEMLHAVDAVYNADSLEEDAIERLSQGLYQVFKDNRLNF